MNKPRSRLILVAAITGFLLGGGWSATEVSAQAEAVQVVPAPAEGNAYFSEKRPELPANHPYRQPYQQSFDQSSMAMGGFFGGSSVGRPQFNAFSGADGRARSSYQQENTRIISDLELQKQETRLELCKLGQQEFCF